MSKTTDMAIDAANGISRKNPVRRLWRWIRQQDRLDELALSVINSENNYSWLDHEHQLAINELQWRKDRQSEGSRKGWQTRKARDEAQRKAMQDADITAMIAFAESQKQDGNRATANADGTS